MDDQVLHIEADLAELKNSEGACFLSQEDKEKISTLESNRNKILKENMVTLESPKYNSHSFHG